MKVRLAGDYLTFWCPGCDESHQINISPGGWYWDQDLERPTISPSILVQSGHYAPGWNSGSCWCTYNRDHPDDEASFHCERCHSFVRNGMIEFLGDCSHKLANQTVELPEWED